MTEEISDEEKAIRKTYEDINDCIDCFMIGGQLVCFKYSNPDIFFYNDEEGNYCVYPVTDEQLEEIRKLGLNKRIS